MPNNPTRWRCPSCHMALHTHNKQQQCTNKHTYDIAKEGYVNLLLAQHKNSKQPGDNNAMVQARREFLEHGHYSPLAALLTRLVADCTQHVSRDPLSVFDAGCGEGYYLNTVLNGLLEQGIKGVGAGIDISKPAVQKAAKKYRQSSFAVASSYAIPLLDNTQDTVLQIFAPSDSEEVKRVLKPDGMWILVSPAANHLFALKQMIYNTPEKHKMGEDVPQGFELIYEERLDFFVALESEKERENLLMMTPFYWQLSVDKKRQILQTLEEVRTDFLIRAFRVC